jgi:hypothetical protein
VAVKSKALRGKHHPTSGTCGTTDFDHTDGDSLEDPPGQKNSLLHETNGGCLPYTLYPIEHEVRAAMTSGRQFEMLEALTTNNPPLCCEHHMFGAEHLLGLLTQPRLLQHIEQILEDLRRIDN